MFDDVSVSVSGLLSEVGECSDREKDCRPFIFSTDSKKIQFIFGIDNTGKTTSHNFGKGRNMMERRGTTWHRRMPQYRSILEIIGTDLAS
mmetsp:Transcript_19031/g.35398  ORF Transcript_19031/g.35398 Transcript_19031/m.35398 type:complete len:90 (+) Transcript_19031:102-371(+)